MRPRVLRAFRASLLVSILAGGVVAYAGCSSDDDASAQPTEDAGTTDTSTDTSTPTDSGPPKDAAPPVDAGPCGNDAPDDLACTGLYSDFAAKTVAADNKPYKPGVVLWSDGAEKQRWIYLPPGTKIDTSDMDQWRFPVGTKLWKEFAFGGKRIETRYYVKTGVATLDGSPGDWAWATYQWSDDQTSAHQVTDGVADAGPHGYAIPSHAACTECHNGSVNDRPLGFEAFGLGMPGATGETLAALQTEGRLTVSPPSTTVNAPDDGKGSKDALPYLHMNCGVSCHNPNPHAFCAISHLDMRLSATAAFADAGADAVKDTDTYKTAVGIAPAIYSANFPPLDGWHRITSGDVAHTEILAVAGSRGTGYQMPPIGSQIVDDAGMGLIGTWVSASP